MAVTTPPDGDLLRAAREGDAAAVAELYRRHRDAALRLARSYRRGGDAEDLVNGAFERVLAALRRGSGPVEAFRPYLFVTLRRLAADRRAVPGQEPTRSPRPCWPSPGCPRWTAPSGRW